MNRKREPHWETAEERARVAAELLAEAEQLLTESVSAGTPPPLRLVPRDPEPEAAAPPSPAAAPPRVAEPAANPPVVVTHDDIVSELGAAQRELERQARTEPSSADVADALAGVLVRRGLWREAVPHLQRAADLAPNDAARWCRLGEALNHVDDLPGARGAYEHAVALDPRHARALYGLGVVLDRLRLPAEATVMYRRSREGGASRR